MLKVRRSSVFRVLMASLLWINVSVAGTLQPAADGTATDSATGLIWMRCSVSQSWSGTTCVGNVNTLTKYTFEQANALTGTTSFAGQNDWRIPTIRELATIADYTLAATSVDAQVFPNAPLDTLYWSSSRAYGDPTGPGWAGSTGGGASIIQTVIDLPVIMVRGSQPALSNLSRPSSDYTDLANGTVLHKPTNLTWQRCMVGQTWTGSACSGTPSTMNWSQANALTSNFAGQTDWRLPTALELQSLVDYTKYDMSINADVFPQTFTSEVWSSSTTTAPNSTSPDFAWTVEFRFGYLTTKSKTLEPYGVRFVRSTPPVDESTEFFSWAEAQYPSLFPVATQSGVFSEYTYRYYGATGLVLALQNRQIYGFGDAVTNRQMINLTVPVCAANPVLAVCGLRR